MLTELETRGCVVVVICDSAEMLCQWLDQGGASWRCEPTVIRALGCQYLCRRGYGDIIGIMTCTHVGHVMRSYSLRFMPVGAMVCKVLIQASSSLSLMLRSCGEESIIVQRRSLS